MLVLSRKRNESIVIGDDVAITVIDIRGDKVRLGINAPLDIPVHRLEVYDRITQTKGEVLVSKTSIQTLAIDLLKIMHDNHVILSDHQVRVLDAASQALERFSGMERRPA